MPFSHSIVALDPLSIDEARLFSAYTSCLASLGDQPESYFVIVRPQWLCVVPRSEGHITIDEHGHTTDLGAGAMLGHIHVGDEEAAKALSSIGSDAILRMIAESGFPR